MKKTLTAIFTSLLLSLSACGSFAGDTEDTIEAREDFNFDAAVQNITLFGEKLSLPCKISDIGGCLSVQDSSEWDKYANTVTADINYNGEKIGTANISAGDLETIDSITLGFGIVDSSPNAEIRKKVYSGYGWYSEKIEADIGGISFDSTVKDIKALLGEPTGGSGEELTYDFRGGSVNIKLSKDEIIRIIISVKYI